MLRALAAILQTGLPMSSALLVWHEHVERDDAQELRSLRNRLLLGQPPREAAARLAGPLSVDASALSALIAIHARVGGDAARMVHALADAAERRIEAIAKAAAHGSGARLSARLIAGLPLAFVPVAPMVEAPIADRPGILLLVSGIGLAIAGVTWISALFPTPERHGDPAARVADLLACGLEAGADPPAVLGEICAAPPPGTAEVMERVRRLLRLAPVWHEALTRSGEPAFEALGRSMRTAAELGLPLSSALRAWAELRRDEHERLFEAAVRRAPVRMAVPLAVCVLPSFIVLGIGPFLRGLSLGA